MYTENQKLIAIECLNRLGIYKPYINKFKAKKTTPCFFENFAGFYVDQEQFLQDKIKEIEEEYGVLVYAVTHELLAGSDCWSMLCVSRNSDSAATNVYAVPDMNNMFDVYAYVWNEQMDWFSEFGFIGVKSFGGGIKRYC